ncbi:hypothetical protein ACI83_001960 [Escherichia coli]|nr:hypothetical protein [Escherichia coli]EFK9025731.1 hypothetical protein [Escherichia coli]EFL3836776.1 hypothetical protein [Escherichia coli]
MNERLKTHSKTQKKSADLVSNKLRIGVFQRYQMKCKSVSKKSPRYTPLKKGQVVGTIDFQLNGKSIEQRPLIVMENVEEGGFFGRMWDFVMMKFHQWFGSWFS